MNCKQIKNRKKQLKSKKIRKCFFKKKIKKENKFMNKEQFCKVKNQTELRLKMNKKKLINEFNLNKDRPK